MVSGDNPEVTTVTMRALLVLAMFTAGAASTTTITRGTITSVIFSPRNQGTARVVQRDVDP